MLTNDNRANMSNVSIEQLIQVITTLFITTTEAQEVKKGRVSVEALLASFKSEEVQEQIKNHLKQGMKRTRASGEKKLKDENAPKKNKNAYMFFCDKKRPQIKEANPGIKATEIAKLLGQSWKEATPESKAKYTKKADADKVRYNAEMADYKRPSDDELMTQKINQKKTRGKASGTKKRTKEEGAPTRGKSAYLFFCADKRPKVKDEYPDMKATEIMSELGRMWKELSDEEKEPYNEQAAEAKEKYLQEKTEWEDTKALEPSKPKQSKPKKSKPVEKSDSEEEGSAPQTPDPKAKAVKKSKPVEKPEPDAVEPESPKPKKSKSKPASPVVSPAPKAKKVFV
jgi:HMG (high mobility group) box